MVALTLAAIEIGARGIEWARARFFPEPHPFVDATNPVPVFEETELDGRRVFARTRHHPLMLPDLHFAAEKPRGGFRVFLLGGSAAGGWPYDLGGYSIADHLDKKLGVLFPERSIEVINAAGGTYASHRVRFVFDEVIDYDPDLIVVYTGNNEFLESFVFRPQLPAGAWKHLAVARIVHRARLAREGSKPSFDVESYNLADQAANRLSYAFGRASRYRRDPEQFRAVVESFRHNLDWMARIAAERGVPIVFLDVPVNLKDWQPNASRHREGLSGPERRRWRESFAAGLAAVEAEDPEGAVEALTRATEHDPEYAEAWYYLGRSLLALGRNAEAREALLEALERDAYPFRAIPPLWSVIEEVAAQHGVPRVAITRALEEASPDGILGAETLVDYVHLSEASQERVAHEVLRTAATHGFLPAAPGAALDRIRIPIPTAFRPEVALREGELLYRQYLVMRQYDRIDAAYDRYVDALTRAPETRPDLADYCARRLVLAQRIQAVLEPYRRLLHAEKIGRLEGAYTREEARRIYASYVALIRAIEAPDMPRERFREFVPPLRYRGARAPDRAPTD